MKILLIEDEVKLADAYKRGLEQHGYAVDVIHDGQEGLDQIEVCHDEYDVIITDLMLPNKDGFEICGSVRSQNITTPIIMLTARDSLSDKVMGLDSGADDYVLKPVAFAELLARVRSLLRRPANVVITKLIVGDLVLDPSSRTVTKKGKNILLTTKEFAILEYLMHNQGVIVSRETLLSHVWNQDFDSFSNVVNVHVANLKGKIDNSSHDTIIKSVRGSGYRIDK